MTSAPGGTAPIDRILTPFREFARTEASGGIVLLIATIAALVWANSPWSASYDHLWHTELTLQLGRFGLAHTLAEWINDGLMVIFFFVVGLEIKREVLVGELNSPRRAVLPAAAAAGGAITPALIYLAFNIGTGASHGWGVPMATDIAFVLGVLALFGSRAPSGLKIFLAALAITDDLIAVLVIAIFYTTSLSWLSLAIGAGFLVALIAANRLGVTSLLVYALLGIGLWLAFLHSGVHATIAGVLLAITIPARTKIAPRDFVARAEAALSIFRTSAMSDASARSVQSVISNSDQQAALQDLESATEHVQAPLQRYEHALHPWVAYLIIPVFALANAGVALGGGVPTALTSRVGFGIIVGLIVGKQVGITLSSWVIVRLGLADLPDAVGWRHVYGGSWLAGIGFTMALFIGDLAFSLPVNLAQAKIGILAASVIAVVGGWQVLSTGAGKKAPGGVDAP